MQAAHTTPCCGVLTAPAAPLAAAPEPAAALRPPMLCWLLCLLQRLSGPVTGVLQPDELHKPAACQRHEVNH